MYLKGKKLDNFEKCDIFFIKLKKGGVFYGNCGSRWRDCK